MDTLANGSDEAGVVSVRRARSSELSWIIDLSHREICDEVMSVETLERIQEHNEDTCWVIESDGNAVGFFVFFFLNSDGHAAFEAGQFNGIDPAFAHLTPGGVRPAAIYTAGVVARGLTVKAVPLVANALSRELYGGLPLLARAVTRGGAFGLNRFGFERQHRGSAPVGDTFRLERPENYKPRYGLG
jgi:hypothetical protein